MRAREKGERFIGIAGVAVFFLAAAFGFGLGFFLEGGSVAGGARNEQGAKRLRARTARRAGWEQKARR